MCINGIDVMYAYEVYAAITHYIRLLHYLKLIFYMFDMRCVVLHKNSIAYYVHFYFLDVACA